MYLSSEITTQSIMLEGVIPDKDVGNITLVLRSPLRLPSFASNMFSLEQLLVDSSSPFVVLPLPYVPSGDGVGSSIGSSFSHKRKCTLTPHQFKDYLRDVFGHPFLHPLSMSTIMPLCIRKIVSFH